MSGIRQDETPTKPSPVILKMENGHRTVKTGSPEHRALVAAGYATIEHDDVHTILRLDRRVDEPRDRRAAKADRRKAGQRATNGEAQRYRDLEDGVLQQIAAEFQAAGHHVEAGQLRWAMDEFRRRVFREAGKYQVNGRVVR